MYLIPQRDYDEYYEMKHNKNNVQASDIEEKNAKNELLEKTYDDKSTEQQKQQPEVSGEGKINNDILLKRYNAEFQNKQNLEKHLEEQITQKIYAKLLPLLEKSTQMTKQSLQDLFQDSSTSKKSMLLPLFSQRKAPASSPFYPTLRTPGQPLDSDESDDNFSPGVFATPRQGQSTPFVTPETSKKVLTFSTPHGSPSPRMKLKKRSRKRNDITPAKNVSPYPVYKSTRLGKRARMSSEKKKDNPNDVAEPRGAEGEDIWEEFD